MPTFHRIQYRALADAGAVRTFDPTAPAAAEAVRRLRDTGTDPWANGGRRRARPVRLAPGESLDPVQLDGPGLVTEVALQLPQAAVRRAVVRGPTGEAKTALDVRQDGEAVRIVRTTTDRTRRQTAPVLVEGREQPQWFGPLRHRPDGRFEQVLELPADVVSDRRVLLSDVAPGRATLEAFSLVDDRWRRTDRVRLPPTVSRGEGDAAAVRLLRDLRLQISFDGQRTVDAPIGEFFGAGLGPSPVASLLFAADEEEGYRAWWPMPYARQASISLHNGSDQPVDTGLLEVRSRSGGDWEQALGPEGRAGLFHATSRAAATRDGRDWRFVDLGGHGKVVGFSHVMVGHDPGRTYLEGDERVHVDGAASPQLHGTGTEDLYLAGWYFNRGPFSSPFSGLAATFEQTSSCPEVCDAAWRLLVADALPFHRELTLGIEHGPTNRFDATYHGTTFWYGRDGAALRRTDVLDVGSAASERAHDYVGDEIRRSLTSTYAGSDRVRQVVDDLRESSGQVRFRMDVDPDNVGVLLRRRADHAAPGQAVLVEVDGVPARAWVEFDANRTRRWRDDDLLLPASVTRGKEAIELTLRPLAGSVAWTAARYETHSLLAPGDQK